MLVFFLMPSFCGSFLIKFPNFRFDFEIFSNSKPLIMSHSFCQQFFSLFFSVNYLRIKVLRRCVVETVISKSVTIEWKYYFN